MSTPASPQTSAAPPPREDAPRPGALLLLGLLVALGLGLPAGWLRYWFGLFALALGAGGGLLHAWLLARLGRRRGLSLAHPGFKRAAGLALAWLVAFWLGQLIGLGLAQPWFDPLGWLGRLLDSRTVEPIFGLASTAGIHKVFAGGFQGAWWVVFNLVDWAIMFFFMLAMPWRSGRGQAGGEGVAAPAGER